MGPKYNITMSDNRPNNEEVTQKWTDYRGKEVVRGDEKADDCFNRVTSKGRGEVRRRKGFACCVMVLSFC